MLGMSGVLDQSDMVLPRHSVAVFKNFCTWMTLDAERSRSLESMVRSVGLCQDFFINAGKFLSGKSRFRQANFRQIISRSFHR